MNAQNPIYGAPTELDRYFFTNNYKDFAPPELSSPQPKMSKHHGLARVLPSPARPDDGGSEAALYDFSLVQPARFMKF
jgi:hypothetical protein